MNRNGLKFVINSIVKGCTEQMKDKENYSLTGKIYEDEYWHVIFSDFSQPIKEGLKANGIQCGIVFELNDNARVLKYTINCWRHNNEN